MIKQAHVENIFHLITKMHPNLSSFSLIEALLQIEPNNPAIEEFKEIIQNLQCDTWELPHVRCNSKGRPFKSL